MVQIDICVTSRLYTKAHGEPRMVLKWSLHLAGSQADRASARLNDKKSTETADPTETDKLIALIVWHRFASTTDDDDNIIIA